MNNKLTTWILTAALAFCAQTGVPVTRLELVGDRTGIVWRYEDRQQQRIPDGHRVAQYPPEQIPQALSAEPRVGLPLHSNALYNRPPPTLSL